MLFIKSIGARFALILVNLIFLTAAAQGVSSDSYTVAFNQDNPGEVAVTATLTLENNYLKMSAFGPMPERWSDYVYNLKASNLNGKPITLKLKDSTAWVLSGAQKAETITISYKLRIDHEDIAWPGGIDGVAFVRPWGVLLSGRSLFVMNGTNKKNIKVQFITGQGWKVSCPWSKLNGAQNTYLVENQTQLQESLIVAGTHQEINIPNGDFNLKFVLGGDKITNKKQEYIDNAKKVLDYYVSLMGGNPIPGPNNNLSTAMVVLNQSEQIDGEVIGNHLSMFINPEGDMQSQTIGWFLFAHEFFHLWNGKTLRFTNTTTDWFKEGVSNYYTLKALNQVGIVNEEVTKMVLNNLFYQRYINDSGYKNLAPSKAASGFDKDNHWGIIYGGGLFAGICIDMEIRKNTENQLNLDYVMRELYTNFGGSDKLIDSNKLLATFNNFGNTNFTTFLDAYIHGTQPVPLHEYLTSAGVRVSYQEGQLILEHMAKKSKQQQQSWSGFLGKF